MKHDLQALMPEAHHRTESYSEEFLSSSSLDAWYCNLNRMVHLSSQSKRKPGVEMTYRSCTSNGRYS